MDKKNEIEKFWSYLQEKELSVNTIRAYITAIKQFFQLYDEDNKKNALEWKKVLEESGLKPKSINIKINAYNAYCDMVNHRENRIKTLKVHQATAISNVISEEEYNKLLRCLLNDKNYKWYFNIKLLAVTGARISEYIRLKKSDFDRGYAEMWTKGKIRRIYIPYSFQKDAKEYYKDLKPNDYLCVNRYGNQISTRGFSQMLLQLSKRYKINQKVMHPHSFRHLFAIEFLKKNPNLSLLADVMGHSSVSTTAIYTRLTQEQQKEAVNMVVNW